MAKRPPGRRVMDAINKKLPKLARPASDGSSSEVREVVPTGIEVVDHFVLGCGGLPGGRIGEVFSDAGAGKAQPTDTRVPTPTGWCDLGDLEVGDFVFDQDGMPVRVAGVYPRGRLLVYRVSFSDGAEATCCAEHLWEVWTTNDERRGGRVRVVTLGVILAAGLQFSSGVHKWRAPIAGPVQWQEQRASPIDPYVIGLLLGDGCLSASSAIVSCHQGDVAERFISRLPPEDTASFDGSVIRVRSRDSHRNLDGSLVGSRTWEAVRDFGLEGKRSWEKRVPDRLKVGSAQERMRLLSGLVDSDGYPNKHHVEFSSVSRDLASDVVDLVRGLGGVASLRPKPTTHRTAYRVFFRLPGFDVEAVRATGRYVPPDRIVRSIVGIEEVGIAECVCIAVDSERGLYLTENYIPTHNSSFGFQCLAAGQRAGGASVLITTEEDLITSRAEAFGCDLDELILLEPEGLGEVLNSIALVFEEIPRGCGPNVLVWDSLAATRLGDERGADLGKAHGVGVKARLMSQALPHLSRLARERRFAVVVINQVRDKIGVLFGDSTTTPGGKALKFHASWRLQMWRGAEVKRGSEAVGIHTTVKAVKNKVAPPFKKAKLRLLFEGRWDNEWALINLGKDLKAVPDSARVSKANLAAVRERIGAPPAAVEQ